MTKTNTKLAGRELVEPKYKPQEQFNRDCDVRKTLMAIREEQQKSQSPSL